MIKKVFELFISAISRFFLKYSLYYYQQILPPENVTRYIKKEVEQVKKRIVNKWTDEDKFLRGCVTRADAL